MRCLTPWFLLLVALLFPMQIWASMIINSVTQSPAGVVAPGTTVNFDITVTVTTATTDVPRFDFLIGGVDASVNFASTLCSLVDFDYWECPPVSSLSPTKTFRFSTVFSASGTYDLEIILWCIVKPVTAVDPEPGTTPCVGDSETLTVIASYPDQINIPQNLIQVDESAGSAPVEIWRLGDGVGSASVFYSTQDGTAVSGQDYTETAGIVAWADGDTEPKVVNVPVLNDALAESTETFDLRLLSASGSGTIINPFVATITINDDDPPGALQFSQAAYSGGEDQGSIAVTVQRVDGDAGAVSVNYATSNGTASAGADYTARSGTLDWGAGDSADKVFNVSVLADSVLEAAETVQLTLSSPTGGATLGSPSTATLTIEDATDTLRFSQASYSGGEDQGSVAITVQRVGGGAGAVSVNYATSNGTAMAGADYTATSGTLNWGAGDSADKVFNVSVLEDGVLEAAETVQLTLSNPSVGAALGSPSTATLTINDATVAPTLSVTTGDYAPSGDIGGPFSPLSKTYTLSNAGDLPLNFSVDTNVEWLDLTPPAGTLQPQASAGVVVAVNSMANLFDEGVYSAVVSFSNDTNGTGDTSRNVTLTVTGDGRLVVAPNEGINAYSEGGVVFEPPSISYTLTNTGNGALSFSVSPSVGWLTASPQSGELAPGAASAVNIAIQSAALDVPPGSVVVGEVSFANSTNGMGDTSRWATAVVLPLDSEWNVSEKVDDPVLTSNPVGDNGSATLLLHFDADSSKQLAPANIGFEVRVSSEPDKDLLTFSINGEEQKEWSGEVPWTPELFQVPPGLEGDPLDLEWTYSKDEEGASGNDGASIDVVTLGVNNVRLNSAVLPASRSAQVGSPVTAFATIINSGTDAGLDCAVAPATQVAAMFDYQTTDPLTNAVVGLKNTPINVAGGTSQSFVVAFTPTQPFSPRDVAFRFDCANSVAAPATQGLNTLLLSASTSPTADIVALAATPDGDGIVKIPDPQGIAAFAVATVNLGAGGSIKATADTGSASLPLSLTLCETDPASGACKSAPASNVTRVIGANETPTFGIFVSASDSITFDPAVNRIFVRFSDGLGAVRGLTSVAVRTD